MEIVNGESTASCKHSYYIYKKKEKFSQLTELDSEVHLHVNYKNKLGLTETVGLITFEIDHMHRYMPPTWFKLSKKNDQEDQERGQLQLEYQFANKVASSSSVSNFSLNKIEKGRNNCIRIRRMTEAFSEKKFEKLKRKMHLIGKSKQATSDATSFASVSISRQSSLTSMTSALAFSSPSPNQMIAGVENQITVNHSYNSTDSPPQHVPPTQHHHGGSSQVFVYKLFLYQVYSGLKLEGVRLSRSPSASTPS